MNAVKNVQSTAQTTAVPPGIHPNQRAKHAQQPRRRLSFGEEKTGEREERNGRQRRRHAERIGFDEDGRRRHAVAHEQQHRRAAEDREDWRADRRAASMTIAQARPRRTLLEHAAEPEPARSPTHDAGGAEEPSPPGGVGAPGQARWRSARSRSAAPVAPTHAGTLAAMIVPVSRSLNTSCTAPPASRIVAMQRRDGR